MTAPQKIFDFLCCTPLHNSGRIPSYSTSIRLLSGDKAPKGFFLVLSRLANGGRGRFFDSLLFVWDFPCRPSVAKEVYAGRIRNLPRGGHTEKGYGDANQFAVRPDHVDRERRWNQTDPVSFQDPTAGRRELVHEHRGDDTRRCESQGQDRVYPGLWASAGNWSPDDKRVQLRRQLLVPYTNERR